MPKKKRVASEVNASKTAKKYGRDRHGYFGQPSHGKHVRQITSGNRHSTSIGFYNMMSKGGVSLPQTRAGNTMRQLSDGTRVLHRKTSRSKSPAVDINKSPSKRVPEQRIHFENSGKRKRRRKNATTSGIHKKHAAGTVRSKRKKT